VFATVVLAGVWLIVGGLISGEARNPSAGPPGTYLALCIPPLVILGGVLFVVRGYQLAPGELRVHRLLWATRIDLAGLDRAAADPSAMDGSLRIFGNGGLYAVTGLFQNRTLGRYRAFVTDKRRSVVLHFPDRTVVVSPEDPFSFLHQLRAGVPGVEIAGPPHSAPG
jgi:hypothetical protein